MRFDDRIQLYEYKLNDTDDQIVEYIKENKDKVLNLSIQKLAENLFTVPNTIVRLSRKLGYEGFSELKSALRLEEINENEDFSSISKNIKKTYEIIDEETIDKICRKFKESKDIFFYGVGDSLPFCEMMAKNLKCVGKRAEFFTHRHDMLYSIDNLGSKDLVFIISNSGETGQILEVAQKAKEHEAFIISLTHLCENSLVKLSLINLYCWAPKQKINNYDVTDRISLMIVLRKLNEHYWKYYCE